MADNLSKLVTTMTINNQKLIASQSKLNVAIKNLATQNKWTLALITDTAKLEHTMPPNHYTPSLEDPASSVTTIDNDLVTQTGTPFSSVPPQPTYLLITDIS